MTGHGWVCVDGNEAAARVAHRLSEAVANHPSTPGATTGVHNGLDAAKALLAEANVAMMTSALLRHGPAHVRCVEDELAAMLAERADDSLAQLRGSRSRAALSDPAGFERANHVRTLMSWSSRDTVSSGQAASGEPVP
jgi:pyruvate/2-oxoacid:ferredoxin oxidoreductase alpha subunit